MAISNGPSPANNTSLYLQIGKIRDDSQTLETRSGALTSSFAGIQQTSFDSYNAAHDAFENASDASTDDGETDNSANGLALNAKLPGLNANQTTLKTNSAAATTEAGGVQAEIVRLYTALNNVAATVPAGPLGTVIQSALEQLTQANGWQLNGHFDPTTQLTDTDALLTSVAAEAAGIAADVAGSDVSAPAKGAVNDLENAQTNYQQVATGAEQAGYNQTNVTAYLRQTVGTLDQALEMLQPDPPDDRG